MLFGKHDIPDTLRSYPGRAYPINWIRAVMLQSLDKHVDHVVNVKDPLATPFESDRVLQEVTCDGAALFSSQLRAYCLASMLFCPCTLPFDIIGCSPCALPALRKQARDCEDSFRLILRENTLLYKQKSCRLLPSAAPSEKITLYETCSHIEAPAIEMLIPLFSGDGRPQVQVELMKASRLLSGLESWYPVDTIVVRVGKEVLVALDAPVKGAEFVEACKRQMEEARSVWNKVYQSIPVNILDAHDATTKFWRDSACMIRRNPIEDPPGAYTVDGYALRQTIDEFLGIYNEYLRVVRLLMEGKGRFINDEYFPDATANAEIPLASLVPVNEADMVRDDIKSSL